MGVSVYKSTPKPKTFLEFKTPALDAYVDLGSDASAGSAWSCTHEQIATFPQDLFENFQSLRGSKPKDYKTIFF